MTGGPDGTKPPTCDDSGRCTSCCPLAGGWGSEPPSDFPGGSEVRNLPANTGEMGLTPGGKDPLEKEMATHSSILAREIPRTEEPDGLQSMGSQKSRTRLSNSKTTTGFLNAMRPDA